jgi:hypothetical protein
MAAETTGEKRGSGGFNSSVGSSFGKLEQVFDDVWWAWGTMRFMPGVLFPRSMTIVRERGELIVIHPIMMPEAEQAKIEALGPIKHIVRLGAFHGIDDPKYVKRYSPTIWAPPGVDLRPGVKTGRELSPGAELPLPSARLFSFETSRTPETVIHLDRHGGILFTCDSVQNWETTTGASLLGRLMAKVMGFQGRACIGPGWRRQSEPKDGVGFARTFEKLLQLDFRHALSAHGPPMKDTARDDLRAQVRRLYGASSA